MKKTHTKNMLSMAPTLHMFTKSSLHKEEKIPSAVNPGEIATTTTKNTSLKYNRSISSFRKHGRDSPEKKFSALMYGNNSKSRPTLPKGMIQAHPFEKMVEILQYDINARSQQNLYQDFVGKMDGCVRILEDSMQSETIIRVFKQIKRYFSKIFSITVRLHQKKLGHFTQQVAAICNEYETKLKQAEQMQKQRIRQQFLNGQSEMGKKIEQMKARALFNSRIFNQMESTNIDMMTWIKQSETLDEYIYNKESPESKLQTIDKQKQQKNVFDSKINSKQKEEDQIQAIKKQYIEEGQQFQFLESIQETPQAIKQKTLGQSTNIKSKNPSKTKKQRLINKSR